MKKKKILFVLSNLRVGGGAEKSASMVAKELFQRGYDVSILTYYDFENEYSIGNVKRYTFGKEYKNNFIQKGFRLLLEFPYKLKKFYNNHNFDLIISSTEDANFTNLFCKKLFKNKIKLWTVIRNNILNPKYIYRHFINLHKYANNTVVLTESIKEDLKNKIQDNNLLQIYNPVDIDKINELKKEKINSKFERQIFEENQVLLSVGRLAYQKNYFYLIDVFKEVLNKKDGLKLVIIGDGDLENDLKSYIKKNNLENHVFLFGLKNNVFKYMSKCDLYVFPSRFEGFGRVLVEALSCGAPIVSNNCKYGPSEILNSEKHSEVSKNDFTIGKYGILVPFGEKKEFAKAILFGLDNKKKFRKKAVKRSKAFNIKNITDTWEAKIKKQKKFYK